MFFKVLLGINVSPFRTHPWWRFWNPSAVFLVVVFLSSIKSWTEFTRLQFKEICDCAVFPDMTSSIQNVLLHQTNSLIRSRYPCAQQFSSILTLTLRASLEPTGEGLSLTRLPPSQTPAANGVSPRLPRLLPSQPNTWGIPTSSNSGSMIR